MTMIALPNGWTWAAKAAIACFQLTYMARAYVRERVRERGEQVCERVCVRGNVYESACA